MAVSTVPMIIVLDCSWCKGINFSVESKKFPLDISGEPFVGACVEANVQNSPYCQELWDEINALGEKYRDTLTTESLKEMSGIAATRKVYRACGKDPSRYRPASEALIRRMLQGKQLYQRDTLVDLVNLASIAFGYSIGGFDADKFEGDTLTLGVGRPVNLTRE